MNQFNQGAYLIATQVNTPAGIIEVSHSMTLGDMMIGTVLVLNLAFGILKWIVDKTWGSR